MFPFYRFKVLGHSMEPLFKEGDKILINSFSYFFAKPEPGDVVAVRHPRKRGMILLKKVEKILEEGKYFVVGLHEHEGEDSRKFGSVRKNQILGKVLTKYSFS